MPIPSHADTFEVFCLQAADEGRGELLFGECLSRVRTELGPFMVGPYFPTSYLEFPLIGEPFLDVTVLYGKLQAGTRIDSRAAEGAGPVLDWFADACSELADVSFGFEMDMKDSPCPLAAIHFQPREHTDLVVPFCEAVGAAQAAPLYLGLNERMPSGWKLSFLGLFRGRPNSPLRISGYIVDEERVVCADNPQHLARLFDEIGFSAYDERMLAQVSALLALAPGPADFQLDVHPDETLGDMFALDVQFDIDDPKNVRASFRDGPGARVMKLLEQWGIADKRWKRGVQAAFARAIPVELDDGTIGRYAFALMPLWVKVRWIAGVLQPAKLYHQASADTLA